MQDDHASLASSEQETAMADQRQYASFHRAYLVAADQGSTIVGVARKEGPVWRAIRFGVAADEQPSQRFATRQEAAEYLMKLNPASGLRLGRQ